MKYPNGIIKTNKNIVLYGNRGMSLEADINATNEYYLVNGIAVIHKKPTPITITKVDFPNRHEAVIKEAYFKIPSTTDYNGIYKGKYIDFEAKECSSKTAFPIINIHPHQIKHLKDVINHGAIAFILIRFTHHNQVFYLDGKYLIDFIESAKRKSIPYSFFKEKGIEIKDGFNPRLDYLKVIDSIYFGGDCYGQKIKF